MAHIYIYRGKTIAILKDIFEDSVANRIFLFLSHPVVDVFRTDTIVSEVIKYPTHINSFSDWYLNEFNNEQWRRMWEWKRRWRKDKQVEVRRKIDDGRQYIYR